MNARKARKSSLPYTYKRQLLSQNQVHSMDTSRPDIKHFYENPKSHILKESQSITRCS